MNPLSLVLVAGVAGATGVAVGYKIAERNLTVQFEERLLRETDAMRVYYQQTTKKFATPQEAAADLIPPGAVLKETKVVDSDTAALNILEKTAYHKIVQKEYDKPEQETEPPDEDLFPPNRDDLIESNIFEDPKIIPQGDFMENETGYSQATLTYYEVDRTLTDERDQVIENKDDTVGPGGIFSMFGMDSSDPNTVHVRNPRLQMEFEIVRHRGSYAKEILGLDDDVPERPSGRGR